MQNGRSACWHGKSTKDPTPSAFRSPRTAPPCFAEAATSVTVEVENGLARDPVSEARIRLWCDALEDHNPVYSDPVAAAASRFRHIVAPPAMLETWVMPPLTYPDPVAPRPEA